MSNTCTITVPPGTDLRNVLSEASSFTDVRIILKPGKHTWAYNSRWEYDPEQGWYLDGNDGEPGADFPTDEHLVIDHPCLELVGDETCFFPSHHIWYDPSKVTIDARLTNLHTIMYHNIHGTIFARCGAVVPADWFHISSVDEGELLIIPDIDDPYGDESCWSRVTYVAPDAQLELEDAFQEPFYTLENCHI